VQVEIVISDDKIKWLQTYLLNNEVISSFLI
jgi:hypothetical protein